VSRVVGELFEATREKGGWGGGEVVGAGGVGASVGLERFRCLGIGCGVMAGLSAGAGCSVAAAPEGRSRRSKARSTTWGPVRRQGGESAPGPGSRRPAYSPPPRLQHRPVPLWARAQRVRAAARRAGGGSGLRGPGLSEVEANDPSTPRQAHRRCRSIDRGAVSWTPGYCVGQVGGVARNVGGPARLLAGTAYTCGSMVGAGGCRSSAAQAGAASAARLGGRARPAQGRQASRRRTRRREAAIRVRRGRTLDTRGRSRVSTGSAR
jgi:hypothetical protein